MKTPPEIEAALEWLKIYALIGWSLINTEYDKDELYVMASNETNE